MDIENSLRLKSNLDTNFIKIVAIISMTLDHFGHAFFPNILFFVGWAELLFRFFAIA